MGCETEEDIKELGQLKKELAKDPNNVDLLLKIGMLLFDPFMDMEIGLPYFEKAMKLDPKNPDLPFWTGYALYHDQCAYEESKKLFERSLFLDPNRAEFHYMMFNVLLEIESCSKRGEKHLLKAIELQPEWLSPREQYITDLTNNNEFGKAEKELLTLQGVIESRCKKGKITAINILEKFYFGKTGFFDCEAKMEIVNNISKELEEKKRNLFCKSKNENREA